MRKPQQTFDLEIPDDYKLASVLERDRADFESTNIWFYVGADYRDRRFAKVGITMGDLRSRSYSSSNPDYYLFCGFQCKHDTTRADLKNIERDVLSYLDEYYPNRAPHRESRRLSECFYDINFEDFFVDIHQYLHDKHYKHFQIMGFQDGESYALSWLFNSCLPSSVVNHFLNAIRQCS